MWKILGLVILCGPLSPSEGNPFANRASFNDEEIAKDVISGMLDGGLLLNHLKQIKLSDVTSGKHPGQVAGIAGLKIVNFEVIGYTQPFVPEIRGADLSFSVCLDIIGHTLPDLSKPVRVFLDVTFRIKYGLVDFLDGYYKVSFQKCHAEYGAMNITYLGWKSPTPLVDMIRDSLIADLNLQICAVLKAVYDVAKKSILHTINIHLPLGPYGTVRCALARLPSVYASYAAVNIYMDVEVPGQGVLSIPDSAGCIDVPPLNNFKHCQAFHPAFFNIVLSVLAPKEPRELSCGQDKFSRAEELRNAVLALLPNENQKKIPANQKKVPVGNALFIRISLEGNPVIVFGNEGIRISVTLKVEFFLRNPGGSIYYVLVVRSKVILFAEVSLVKGRLIFVASISENTLVLISSDAGISGNVSSLEPHCSHLLRKIFLPPFNDRLAVGIPVLSIYGTILQNPTFWCDEGALVACI